MAVTIRLPAADGEADVSGLPLGVSVETSIYDYTSGDFICTLGGDPNAIAAAGLLHADDARARAERVVERLQFDRLNSLARNQAALVGRVNAVAAEIGRPGLAIEYDGVTLVDPMTLILVEPDIFGVIQAALAAGLGDPGPRPDVE